MTDESENARNDARAEASLNIGVSWSETGPGIDVAKPSASEVAALLLGIEESYRILALSLGYPPHFLKVTSIQNPELKVSLEGGKDAIEALRQLILAVPRFIANLFRPRAAIGLADLENFKERKRLEAEITAAEADRIEAELRRTIASREIIRYRQELETMPIGPDPEAHEIVRALGRALAAAGPEQRGRFIDETMKYLIKTHNYVARAEVAMTVIAPAHRDVPGKSNVSTVQKHAPGAPSMSAAGKVHAPKRVS